MLKALCIHAHFDDYEFVLAGLFELWRRRLGSQFQGKVIVCTDGQAGHHSRPRTETGQIRIEEQRRSAEIGGYEFEVLRCPDGSVPRDGCLEVNRLFLAGLWKAIREFEPDYLFAPPVPTDPLAGIHVDHAGVADGVRKVAYLINVPHAFTPEYPADETQPVFCKTPVIINLHDAYMTGANSHDLAIDVEAAFELIAQVTYCHQSQISEWLPWIARHDMPAPASLDDWKMTLRRRFNRRNREMGLTTENVHEFFTLTSWGELPDHAQILRDFPSINPAASNLDKMSAKIARWRTA